MSKLIECIPADGVSTQSVLQACDSLGGTRDGMLSSIAACHFNPATLLRPAGGKDCLTAQQLKMAETFAIGQRAKHPLWNDVQTMPGFNVLAGADLTGPMGLMHRAEHPTRILLNSFHYVVGDQVLRFFLTGDPHFNTLSFDTTTGGKYAADLLPQSEASDASNGNLAAFAQHGGKFLMLHGAADAIIPIGSSVLYYKRVQGRMSQQEMDRFLRFYLVPGYGHGRDVFNAGFDALRVLGPVARHGRSAEESGRRR